MTKKNRVAITGTGILTCIADDRAKLHDAMRRGLNGLRAPVNFKHEALDDHVVGEIAAFTPQNYLEKKNFRPLNRTALLLTSAAELAIKESGWTEEMRGEQAVGLVVGTTFCSMSTISKFDCTALTEGPKYTSPLDFANTVINGAAGQCAIWHGLRGVNSTISSGIASSLDAIAYAAGLIRDGHENVILSGGVEELCVESLLGFQRAGLLDDDGFAQSEGAALLMLENYEYARKRGATILAEVKGAGTCFDASMGGEATLESRAEAIADAMKEAISISKLQSSQIDAISASANGHKFMDNAEKEAIKRVFNGRSQQIPIATVKNATGEMLGASGAVQVAAMVRCLDSEPSASESIAEENYLVNGVGIDGNCTALVVAST